MRSPSRTRIAKRKTSFVREKKAPRAGGLFYFALLCGPSRQPPSGCPHPTDREISKRTKTRTPPRVQKGAFLFGGLLARRAPALGSPRCRGFLATNWHDTDLGGRLEFSR